MSSIWLIQDPYSNIIDSATLSSNFAVRLIASARSFKILVRMHRERLPSLILVSPDSFCEEILTFHQNHIQKVPCIVITERPVIGQNIVRLNHQICVWELLTLIDEIIKKEKYRIFKDIILDTEKRAFRIEPNLEWESLSNRELSLLGYLLDHCKQYVSKDEIKTQVWPDAAVSPRTIASQVSRLRKRLEPSEVAIESSYGLGYRIV